MRDIECPKCDGEGEIFSGYYKHPETYGEGGPLMYICSLCNGWCVVTEETDRKYRLDRTVDPF